MEQPALFHCGMEWEEAGVFHKVHQCLWDEGMLVRLHLSARNRKNRQLLDEALMFLLINRLERSMF